MNIPARYCNGYLGDIGVPPDPAPMDFNAWFEAYLGGRWYTFDARHNMPRIGRIVVAAAAMPPMSPSATASATPPLPASRCDELHGRARLSEWRRRQAGAGATVGAACHATRIAPITISAISR